MLTGERRFPSARRGGGMTVLGKVTVPKPINLPSQRLENHGLDPNVEIVPKGTLNWGTRSSSSAQNAWASPAQSPPKTGASGSPNYLNSRPSSGGGTRPSTAGSDKSHDPVPNVWGPNSRPSSASGVLTSNQTSVAAARPRSAEPRPASSQLSRFAEPISENSVTWGAPGTMDKLGTSSSRGKDFSLSSGDFPTLGSEKTSESISRQGHSSQGRPVSASGRAATPEQGLDSSGEDCINTMKEKGAVNTLKSENILEVEARDPPSMDKWQRENNSFPNQNMPPQQFGPWHGTPPHNPPNGVWYRGPFGGHPYGPPGPPGSYPHEPFAYYHPSLPARPGGNLQPVLPPGSAPSGYFPDKGDSHQPHMPDSYMPPVMPFGPSPYPVQVPYDGYYGPPRVGSYISSERRPPVLGMATAPCVYNRYPIRNAHPDSDKFHGSSGYAPSTRAKEQGGSGNLHGTHQGPYKVLLKHHDSWDEKDSKDEQEHTVIIPSLERENLPAPLTRESGQGPVVRHNEQMNFWKATNVTSSQYADSHGDHSHGPVCLDAHEIGSKVNRIDNSSVQKQETPPIPGEDMQEIMPAKKNPTLIQKIERLNNKARMKDGQYDEKLKTLRVLNAKADDISNESGVCTDNPSKTPTSGTLFLPTLETGPTDDKRVQVLSFTVPDTSRPNHASQASADNMSNSSSGGGIIHHNAQKRSYGVQGRSDNRNKGRSNLPKDEEWRKKPFVAGCSTESNKDDASDDNLEDRRAALRASEEANLSQGEVVGDMSAADPSDHQSQRVKMREIVAERAKQLQKEEEERTREQKARALAKLEELNRRTADISTEKMDKVLTEHGLPQLKQEISAVNTVGNTNESAPPEVKCSGSGWDCDIFTPSTDYNNHGFDGSSELPEKVSVEVPICSQKDPTTTNKSCLPSSVKVETKSNAEHKISQGCDTIVPKQKQIGHKKKQHMNKDSYDRSISTGDSSNQKSPANLIGDSNSFSGVSNPHRNSSLTDDSLLKHKKKNNSGGKNKHKLDEASSTVSPKLVPNKDNSARPSNEVIKPKTSVSVFEVGSVQVPFSIEIADGHDSSVPSTDQQCSQSTEDVHTVVNNQLKNHPRRVTKNTHSTRATEKLHTGDSVVWAPVGSLKKNDSSENPQLNGTVEVHNSTVIGRGTQSNHKSRRAEMERYVPKPVAKEAKELSVLVNIEDRPASSINQSASDASTAGAESLSYSKEIGGPDGSSAGKGGSLMVSKNGETKHSKHEKAHGLWRPRTSVESAGVQPPLEEEGYSSGPSKTVQKSFEQRQSQKVEIYVPKEQGKYPNNSNASNFPTSNEPVTEPVLKDHGAASRGKRQSFKGNRTSGNIPSNSDHNDLHGRDIVEVGSQSVSFESTKLDAVGGKHAVDTFETSHWQPKSQAPIAQDRQGSSRASGGQRVPSRGGKAPKKEYPNPGREHLAPRTDKDYSHSLVQSRSDISIEQKIAVPGERYVHQEIKPERKGVSLSRQGPQSSDHHPAKLKDPTENVNNEQSLAGQRRHNHQNRFGRGHEVSHVDKIPLLDENSRQNPPYSDKRRHDSHYEYQRARSNGNESVELSENGPRQGSRYREKSQTHSRRGGSNSYARDSGSHRVPATSGDREQNPKFVAS